MRVQSTRKPDKGRPLNKSNVKSSKVCDKCLECIKFPYKHDT